MKQYGRIKVKMIWTYSKETYKCFSEFINKRIASNKDVEVRTRQSRSRSMKKWKDVVDRGSNEDYRFLYYAFTHLCVTNSLYA